MQNTQNWIAHFKRNQTQQIVDWNSKPNITPEEIERILPSLQAWQLGETSEGRNLIAAATKYAAYIGDPDYVTAVELFIKEEQKHGNNLGTYLDKIGKPRIKKNWGDSMFRAVRYFNTSMEIWTLAVIVVESTAQIFYQAMKDATQCELLQLICKDILIDEAYHIVFQTDRLAMICLEKSWAERRLRHYIYKSFFYFVAIIVWLAHQKLFKAGGNTFGTYLTKMKYKYMKTLNRITNPLIYQAGFF